eukprot:gene16967-23240_t
MSVTVLSCFGAIDADRRRRACLSRGGGLCCSPCSRAARGSPLLPSSPVAAARDTPAALEHLIFQLTPPPNPSPFALTGHVGWHILCIRLFPRHASSATKLVAGSDFTQRHEPYVPTINRKTLVTPPRFRPLHHPP